MRVYGWQGWRGEVTREIVAASSIAEVMRITGETRSSLFNIGETANPEAVKAALATPGTVLWKPIDDRRGPYREDA